MASSSRFVVPAAGGIKRSHKSPGAAGMCSFTPSKKRVDRKSTPVGFQSGKVVFDHDEGSGPATQEDLQHSSDSQGPRKRNSSDDIISPAHPKWNQVLDIRLHNLVSELGTLSWKDVRNLQECLQANPPKTTSKLHRYHKK
jgi:hypothetical protein